MNHTPCPPGNRSPRSRWWLVGALLLAAGLGPGRAWWDYRRGPERSFRAAQAAFAQNDLDAVQAASEGLRGVDGYAPHRHLLEGMLRLRSGRLVEAIQEFGYAKDHPQTAAQAHLLSGEALYRDKNFRDAQRILAKALELDPSLLDARRWLAALYYDIGAMSLAREQLLKIAEEAPDDPRPLRLQALIDKDFELYSEAIPEYRESLRRDPDQPDKEDVSFELAECLFKSSQYAESLETLADCPRSARTLALEAECRHALGEDSAARPLVDESLKLAPDHLDALLLAATLRMDAGELDPALQLLSQAKKHHSKDSRVYHKLAQIYRRLGRQAEATEHAEKGRQLREQMTRFAELHRAAIRDPGNVEVRYQLGQAAQALDKEDLARSWFEAVLAVQPDHAAARKSLQALAAPRK